MADSICGEVEGDYSTVKVQLAGGGKDEKPSRPTKGTQLVWGGTDPSSPWGHLQALIEKASGSVGYTFIHAADLKEPLVVVAEEETKEEEHEEAPAPAEKKPAGGGGSDAAKKDEPKHATGGVEGHGPLFDNGVEFDFGGNKAK